MPPKKDLKKIKRKPRKKTKVTNQNVNKQTVIIHNNTQPAKRKYTRRAKPKEKDKFSVPSTGESFVLNLLSRFQNQQPQQDYAQLKNTPEPSPKMPHEKLEYDYNDNFSDLSEEEDGRTFDMDNLSRFTGDTSQVSKYGNLQPSIKEEEDVFQDATAEEEGSGGGAEEKITTPVQSKKRNEPSSASPAKTRNASKRWEKYNDELLLNEEQKYLKYLGNPTSSESTKKTHKSNLINIRKEITRRNIR